MLKESHRFGQRSQCLKAIFRMQSSMRKQDDRVEVSIGKTQGGKVYIHRVNHIS